MRCHKVGRALSLVFVRSLDVVLMRQAPWLQPYAGLARSTELHSGSNCSFCKGISSLHVLCLPNAQRGSGQSSRSEHRTAQSPTRFLMCLLQTDNVNRRDDEAEARSVEAAISALAVQDAADSPDRHPERCVVAQIAFCQRLFSMWNLTAMCMLCRSGLKHAGE